SHCPRITNDELPLLPPRKERESAGMRPAPVAPESGRTNGFNRSFTPSFFVNGCGKFSPGAKSLECGDLSPLLPLWRLVAKAGPRPAARESWTPWRIRRRQVACRKRGQARALQIGCSFAALGAMAAAEVAFTARVWAPANSVGARWCRWRTGPGHQRR